tara:strand:- start:184 stop:348 length:165 start_codon:yes stop_codon:yes gene_type:complete
MSKHKRIWPYTTDAPKNRQWNKDRKKLFAENGNGWWRQQGVYTWKKEENKTQEA